MRHFPLASLAGALVAFAAVATPPADAQTLYTLDGSAAVVTELSGPPAGPCTYPDGPVVGGFPYALGSPCTPGSPLTPGPIIPPAPQGRAGGMTTNALTDTVWVTDGLAVTEFTAAGAPLVGWPSAILPGPLTGLAFDSLAGILFMTDGVSIVGVLPGAAGCVPPTIAVAPWPALPTGSPPLTGLTWDPAGFLWGVDAAGGIWTIPPGVPGAFAFPVIPDPVCGALGPLGPMQGISLDRASLAGLAGFPPALYVTDGITIVYVAIGGGPAAPTFYTTANCIPVAGAPISGLAYTSHGITYGKGTDPAGLVPPRAFTTGQFSSPSGPITIELVGADPTPGTVASLALSLGAPFGAGAACPPISGLGGNLIQVAPPFLTTLGPFPVAGGSLTLPGTIPPTFAGIQIMGQWFVGKGSGGIQVTNGIEFTIGFP